MFVFSPLIPRWTCRQVCICSNDQTSSLYMHSLCCCVFTQNKMVLLMSLCREGIRGAFCVWNSGESQQRSGWVWAAPPCSSSSISISSAGVWDAVWCVSVRSDNGPILTELDIAIDNEAERNADPCTSRGCKWLKNSDGKVYIPYYITDNFCKSHTARLTCLSVSCRLPLLMQLPVAASLIKRLESETEGRRVHIQHCNRSTKPGTMESWHDRLQIKTD